MTGPKISWVTLTFGRPSFVCECLQSFLQQDYENREMIILNSFPHQTLVGEFPNVKIVNLTERPKALGECRNIAIQHCTGDFIFNVDDDDVALPNHCSNYASNIDAGTDFIWLSHAFLAEKFSIRGITQNAMALFGFSRKAFDKVGGYDPNRNCGEDSHFASRVTQDCTGKKVELKLTEISYIFGWNNGAYHMQGLGLDKPGKLTGYQGAENEAMQNLRRGRIPKGKVLLKPSWRRDYAAQAKRLVDHMITREQLKHNRHRPAIATQQLTPRIFHAVERHSDIRSRDFIRKQAALRSWEVLYKNHGVIPCHYREYARDSSSIGDMRRLPFLKDVIEFAMKDAGENDIIMWTNDDTILHPTIASVLRNHIAQHQAVSCIRCEFQTGYRGFDKVKTPQQWDAETRMRPASGRDLAAFTKRWLNEHLKELGDYLLGVPPFDYAVAELIRKHHGNPNPANQMGNTIHPSELPKGYIAHVVHNSDWARGIGQNAIGYNQNLYEIWKNDHAWEPIEYENLDEAEATFKE